MTNQAAVMLLAALGLVSGCNGGSDALGPDELSFTVDEHLRTSEDHLGAAANESVVGIGVGGVLGGSLCSHTVHPTGRVSGSNVSLTVEVREIPRGPGDPPCLPVESVITYTALFRLPLGQTYMVRVVHVQQPGNEVTIPFEQPINVCCAR